MIIFDEKKYAENMLKKGFMTNHKNVYELLILSKYYYAEGLQHDEVKSKVVEFCEKQVDFFSIEEWYKIINKTVDIAKKSKFTTGVKVEIKKNELDIIQQLEKLNEQKLAFVMLVLYKFYGCRKFEVSIEDLYRLCKLNINSKSKLELLQSLTSKELIDINMGSKRWVKFAEKDGETIIHISDFDDFIFEYLKYIGEGKYGNCEACGKIIKYYNTKKYCKECSKQRKKEQRKIADRKYKMAIKMKNAETLDT